MTATTGRLAIEVVGAEAAAVVLDLVRAAFADRAPLDPPTDALAETEETIAARLASGAGLVARVDGVPVGCVLLDAEPDGRTVHLRRFGLAPVARGQGVAVALVRAALHAAADLGDGAAERAVVLAREELP
ncbi:GNAT family N-acetyltransferase, partial [Nocardioides stalactiti]|uniref:GNAT family N-acetyltransferase n=1 Tax=Nocardioides stalactiti TaxID=2755356 RepID=UPI0015FF2CCF